MGEKKRLLAEMERLFNSAILSDPEVLLGYLIEGVRAKLQSEGVDIGEIKDEEIEVEIGAGLAKLMNMLEKKYPRN